jgi:hypothetical protein
VTSRREVFGPLTGAEYTSAIAAIVAGGFEATEFVLEERCSTVRQPGGGQPRIYKLISVKRLTIGFQRQYNSGPGGGWPYEFERDLRLLVFGHPMLEQQPAETGARQAKARKTSA